MKKLLLTSASFLLSMSLIAQQARFVSQTQKRSEHTAKAKIKIKKTALLQLAGSLNCSTTYTAGSTVALQFTLLLNNTDFEYGDSLSITFPTGITPIGSPTDPLGPDDGLAGSDGPEILNGVSGQTISWGNNDNNYGGIVAGDAYPFVVNVSVAPGVSGAQTATFHVSGDGFGGNGGDLNGNITLLDVQAPFAGCTPSATYTVSAWQETTIPGVAYNDYVCNGHDSLQTRNGWQFYDGDGYFVKFVAGGQYRITLDSCVLNSAITVVDSNGVSGSVIPGAFVNASCPNQLIFTAPYTGKYYITANLDEICGNSGTTPIATGGIKLLNSVTCPITAPFAGCTPSTIYTASSWQEASAIGSPYTGYVCDGHDSLQTRNGWQFFDGDGYYVNLISGGQYRITLDSCSTPIAISVSDSMGITGTIIPGATQSAACPNQLTFTAPYTGKYYITASVNGICGNIGTSAIASAGVKLLNSATCPNAVPAPINDTICGAIALQLGTTYTSTTVNASATDPRDADATAAGYNCGVPNNTLWYSYTPVVSDTFLITVNSPVGGLDTWVGLFDAANCNAPFQSGKCLTGPTPGTSYSDTVILTAGTNYYVMIDGFGGSVGAFDITLTQPTFVGPQFNGCLPSVVYTNTTWQEPTAIGVNYTGYVCDTHDSLQNLPGWQFFDGDGYSVYLVAGGQYRFSLDSCTAPIALTLSDSNGVSGSILPNAYVNAACPVQFTYTAPYTGKYFLNASLNGICGNQGTTAIASVGVKLLNSATCPTLPAVPVNDTICGAIAMTLNTVYSGDNTTASYSDPRDNDVVAAGYGCSVPNNTLWYSFTPAVSDTFFITMSSPALGGLDAWVGFAEADSCNGAITFAACLPGSTPGSSAIDTVILPAGTTYYIMIDGFANSIGAFSLSITQANGTVTFNGCTPSVTYGATAWQEATAPGVAYAGYVCNGHDSLQTRSGWNFYDGDGYYAYLVAGGNYRISLDSCSAPIGLSVSDSNGVAGALIPGVYSAPACPNQLSFTAPYTGKYYITASLNGLCGNQGAVAIASSGIKLLNSVNCPATPATPVNDTICGAIALTLGSTVNGNTTTASLTDPRDADVIAAGYACSPPNNTLWYSYTAAASDTFFITVNSPAIGGLDAWVGVFEAAACNAPFVTGACLLGPVPGSSYIDTVVFTAGSTYFIMIDGYSGAVGSFDITLTQNNSVNPNYPYNDTLCGAINMTLGTTYSDDNTTASLTDPNDNNAINAGFTCGTPSNTLWYSYTPTVSDTFYISTSSPNPGGCNVVIGLFEAANCTSSLSAGKCFISAVPGAGVHVDTVLLTAGTTYYIMVDGLTSSTGLFTIQLTKANHGVGIANQSSEEELVFYPNPTTGIVQVITAAKKTDLVIYNSVGEKVVESLQLAAGKHILDLSNLAKGMYTIKSSSENKVNVKSLFLLH
jgi:hypothetical protein